MAAQWNNAATIRQWDASTTRQGLQSTAEHGDFVKQHLANPELLRLLGEVAGRRVLDAGCGNGYFSRILAARGASVVGLEPAASLVHFAREQESAQPQGIHYVMADLAQAPDLGAPFDAVVCSMVFMSIPDWRPAMRACVDALRPGGVFVFALVHPAFEGLLDTWRERGTYQVRNYLAEYEIPGPSATDFHRPLSTYLNELTALGCHLREIAEPGLDPEVAAAAEADNPGVSAYIDIPNFLIVAAGKPE